MGIWGIIFLSKEIQQWEAFKKTLKNADDIAEVERTIEFLKKKEAEEKTEG